MATTETPKEIMAALLEGRKPKRRSQTVFTGIYRDTNTGIFSYGHHYCIAWKATEPDVDGWWVNRDRYELTTEDYGHRAPGWNGLNMPRKRLSYSVTTENHRRGVEEALHAAGYRPSGETMTNGYQYMLWTRKEGK